MAGILQPLNQQFSIVDSNGKPTQYFIRWAQQRQQDIGDSLTTPQTSQLIIDWSAQRNINTTAPISGGGSLDADLTLSHDNSGVVAGTYGSSLLIPILTVNATGHVTSAATTPLASGAVTSLSFGTTGLTPNSPSVGNIVVGGTLNVANGGTGTGTPGISAFNNITGFTAAGATGATNTNLVFSGGPTFTSTTTCNGPLAVNQGIQFPAIAFASANPNTLDDYEEGTWTPVDASGAGLSLIAASGYYTRIGQIVFISGQADIPVNASGLDFTIGGLPFVIGRNSPAAIVTPYPTAGEMCLLLAGNSALFFYGPGAVRRTNADYSGRWFYVSTVYII